MNTLRTDWRSRRLSEFTEAIANLGYHCGVSPEHPGKPVLLECEQGHRIKTTPHRFLQGDRCECIARSIESFDLASIVAAEEQKFANQQRIKP